MIFSIRVGQGSGGRCGVWIYTYSHLLPPCVHTFHVVGTRRVIA